MSVEDPAALGEVRGVDPVAVSEAHGVDPTVVREVVGEAWTRWTVEEWARAALTQQRSARHWRWTQRRSMRIRRWT
jgi:hypothetical protein